MSIGERITLAWVRWYTRGLTARVRDDRRAELASDLWEHVQHERTNGRKPFGTQLGLVARSLRGFAADLSWRRGVRSERSPGAARRFASRTLFVLSAASLVYVNVLGSLPMIGISGPLDWGDTGVTWFVRTCAVLLFALTGGLAALRRFPRIGAALASTGAMGTAAYWWWAAVILGPLALVVSVGSIRIGRRSTAWPEENA